MNDVDELALARKLAAKWQLSVPERNSLTPAGIASSSLIEAIREILNESSRKAFGTPSVFGHAGWRWYNFS